MTFGSTMTTSAAGALLLGLLLTCAACGDDDGGSGGNGGSGAAGTVGGGAAGDTGGGPATGGGGQGGGSTGDDRIYPLEVGHRWTYAVAAVGGGAVCGAGTHDAEVLSTTTLGGKQAYEVTSFCTAVAGDPSYYAVDGDKVEFYYNDAWHVVVDPLLEDGHSWTYINTSFTWRQEGPVTVPAGTFDDCWSAVQDVSYTAYTTYCRGVGPVRSYSADLNGAGWDAQLSATNF